MKTLLMLYLFSGALLAAIAVPLMMRRIGPNPLYGFRVEKTLQNPDIWYAANAYSGTQLFWIGLGTIAVSIALYFVPRMTEGTYALACAAFTLGALAISLIMSFRYLNHL
jgi:uncharacterized membrane protein